MLNVEPLTSSDFIADGGHRMPRINWLPESTVAVHLTRICRYNSQLLELAVLTPPFLGGLFSAKVCEIRPKKYLWFRFPTDPIFSADPIIFSTRLTVRPYFLRVVAGCCQDGVCCHTNYWKNHEKNIQKKIYFRPTDPNFFAIWNRYFFRPKST
jgi:hypothetical protein